MDIGGGAFWEISGPWKAMKQVKGVPHGYRSNKFAYFFFSGLRKTNLNVIETHMKKPKKTWCVEARQGRVAPRFFWLFQVGIRYHPTFTCVVGYLPADFVYFQSFFYILVDTLTYFMMIFFRAVRLTLFCKMCLMVDDVSRFSATLPI